MTQWLFSANMEGWTNLVGGVFAWGAGHGFSGGGVKGTNAIDGRGITITISSTPVLAGNPCSFRARVTSPSGGADIEDDVDLDIGSGGGQTPASHTFLSNGITSYDSGWVLIAGEFESNENVTVLSITVRGAGINACDVYLDNVFFLESPGGPAKFYHGLGTLTEKFTLPFASVQPGAMTLDKSLGTVVIGSDEPAAQPVIFSTHPYITGTAASQGFPTGSSVSSLKWV